jgi:hypothetical protein
MSKNKYADNQQHLQIPGSNDSSYFNANLNPKAIKSFDSEGSSGGNGSHRRYKSSGSSNFSNKNDSKLIRT